MSKFNATITGSNVVVIGDNSRLTVDAGRTESKIIIAQELDIPLPPYESSISKLFFFFYLVKILVTSIENYSLVFSGLDRQSITKSE